MPRQHNLMTEAQLRERVETLSDEIDSNNEENRAMQTEIEAIWEEIGKRSNPR